MIVTTISVLGFLAGAVIGGYLARKQAGWSWWTLDDEIEWWIKLIKGGRDAG
jgi:hypothetical protein